MELQQKDVAGRMNLKKNKLLKIKAISIHAWFALSGKCKHNFSYIFALGFVFVEQTSNLAS